jgi:hypothetical protein
MIFRNKEAKDMIPLIIENNLEFSKGIVSGNSIEIMEVDPESHTSIVYYDDMESRDHDFEMLQNIIM